MNTSMMHPGTLRHMGADRPEEMCILKKPIFNNTEIPVPHCEATYAAQTLVGEVCNVNEVGGLLKHLAPIGACSCSAKCQSNADK
jgi:hypothetical protein